MAVSKVVFGGKTLMDLTGDSVTEDALVQGYTAHDAAGNAVGGANPYEKTATDAEVLTQEQLLDEIVDALAQRCVVTEPLLQARTVTPTEEVQVVTPDAGYDGLSSVTVEAAQGGEGTYGWKKYASGLPSGYTEVEYIQSSGTQRINSGFKPNQDTRLVMDVDTGSSWPTEFPALFGVGYTSGGGSSDKFLTYLYKSIGGVHDHYAAQTKNSSTVNMFGRHTFDKNKNNTIVDGITVNQFTYASFQQASPLALFCCLDGGSYTGYMAMKLYSCKIYDNDSLVRDFIPCKNANGAVGLYDNVNGVFYGNEGSGTFTAGPAVSVSSAMTAIGYAVSDDANAYPDGAFLDGYYYEKIAA